MSGDTPNWSSWASAVATATVAALGAVWWLIRRIMGSVTREELITALDSRHQENQGAIDSIRRDIGEIRENVAFLRGQIDPQAIRRPSYRSQE